MKKDKFYLFAGIIEIILGICVFFRNSYILGLIIFLVGILIVIKDYLRWGKIKITFEDILTGIGIIIITLLILRIFGVF